MSKILDAVEQYGNAEHNQDDGQAEYWLKQIKSEVNDLTQQLANSEAAVKALRATLEHTENTLIEVSGQVKSEDARDAERYRQLRQEEREYSVTHVLGGFLWGDELDAAIDAAISAQEPTE